jgi:hypothetical protein
MLKSLNKCISFEEISLIFNKGYEKISKSTIKEYLRVKIYVDELELIIALFDENQIKYSIATDQYKYDNLSELLDSNNDKQKK